MYKCNSVIIHFRAGDNELKSIRNIQKKLNTSFNNKKVPNKSKAIRYAIDNCKSNGVSLYNIKAFRKIIDNIESIREILYRDGGNLNQIAHKLNTGGDIDFNVTNQLINTESALDETKLALKNLSHNMRG